MKKKIAQMTLILIFLLINPIIIKAADVYIIYDNPNGFNSQGRQMATHYSLEYEMYYVRSSSDFIRTWNYLASRSKNIDNLILMLHGGKGVLYFYNESGWNNFLQLKYMGNKIRGNILLLSCHGGSDGANSVATKLSKRSNTSVICAKDCSVNYDYISKSPFLSDLKNGRWIKTYVNGNQIRTSILGYIWDYKYLWHYNPYNYSYK